MGIRKLAGAVYWGELSYCACTLASLASLGPVWALIGSGARIFSSDNGAKALCSAVLEPAVQQPHLAEQSSHRPEALVLIYACCSFNCLRSARTIRVIPSMWNGTPIACSCNAASDADMLGSMYL